MSRVLSIQSHVVHGHVGNKAAVFPLQLLGFDVDFINSVQFSNATGYENGFTGSVMNGEQLQTILQGMERNNLLQDVGYVLTGYIGSKSFGTAIGNLLQTTRVHSANLKYVCDPVLGDNGRLYVPKELIQVYRDILIPQADVVTPNQFEVQQLTGVDISTLDDVRAATDALHQMGPSTVFITSVVLPSKPATKDPPISIIASRREADENDKVWRMSCPRIPGFFTGTGDVTASLLLGHLAKSPNNLPMVLEKTTNTMYAIIQRTSGFTGTTMKSKELKLVQSKADIENPPMLFRAERI